MSKDLTEALRALTERPGGTSRVDKALEPRAELPLIPARSGSSRPIAGATSGGIASPLVETAYSDRTWHSSSLVVASSDLLYHIELQPVKTIKFKDANSQEVVLEFKAPA